LKVTLFVRHSIDIRILLIDSGSLKKLFTQAVYPVCHTNGVTQIVSHDSGLKGQ